MPSLRLPFLFICVVLGLLLLTIPIHTATETQLHHAETTQLPDHVPAVLEPHVVTHWVLVTPTSQDQSKFTKATEEAPLTDYSIPATEESIGNSVVDTLSQSIYQFQQWLFDRWFVRPLAMLFRWAWALVPCFLLTLLRSAVVFIVGLGYDLAWWLIYHTLWSPLLRLLLWIISLSPIILFFCVSIFSGICLGGLMAWLSRIIVPFPSSEYSEPHADTLEEPEALSTFSVTAPPCPEHATALGRSRHYRHSSATGRNISSKPGELLALTTTNHHHHPHPTLPSSSTAVCTDRGQLRYRTSANTVNSPSDTESSISEP